MARAISKTDALRLKKEHEYLLQQLHNGTNLAEQYKNQVKTAADAYIAQEVYNLLKEIPVEELNRDRGGLRIKNLRDAAYTTVADVAGTNVYALAAINGISQDAAYTIKRIAQDFANKARTDTTIRLSVDSKTAKATDLVAALYKYQTSISLANRSSDLLSVCEQDIQYKLIDIHPITGTFKWLFASSTNKQRAEDAYNALRSMMDGEYGNAAKKIINTIRIIDRVDASECWNDFKVNSIKYFTTLENIYPGILGSQDEVYGLPEDLAREIHDECFFPEGLLCELRPYQEWGVKYTLHQERVLLGDEMGLGKTVQAIAAMVSLKNTGATHFLVVCPASVLTNWCREIRKHSRLSVIKVHGSGRTHALRAWMQSGGVAVTTFETTGYIKFEEGFQFSMLVVDEAHYIKNPGAARSKNVRRISQYAERMLFMTGTALENKVDEMIALIDILQPEIANSVRSRAFMSTAPQFRERVAPVYYRRKRDQVLKELPELIENKEWCTMTPQEEAVYEKTVYSKNFMAVRRVSWNVEDLKYSSKARRLLEIVEEAKEDDRKVIVFSFFLDTITSIYNLLGPEVCVNPINGSITPQRRQEIIDEFDNAAAGTVLPAQIQSGGTGLNIQSASVVVICEPQYKPSIENQAISRAYRMGQARNVLVYRLLCENTVDERMLDILERKQAEFDAFADKSAAVTEIQLDDKSFGDIIKEEIDRINAKHHRKSGVEVNTD